VPNDQTSDSSEAESGNDEQPDTAGGDTEGSDKGDTVEVVGRLTLSKNKIKKRVTRADDVGVTIVLKNRKTGFVSLD
jgi:hypothetical protein